MSKPVRGALSTSTSKIEEDIVEAPAEEEVKTASRIQKGIQKAKKARVVSKAEQALNSGQVRRKQGKTLYVTSEVQTEKFNIRLEHNVWLYGCFEPNREYVYFLVPNELRENLDKHILVRSGQLVPVEE